MTGQIRGKISRGNKKNSIESKTAYAKKKKRNALKRSKKGDSIRKNLGNLISMTTGDAIKMRYTMGVFLAFAGEFLLLMFAIGTESWLHNITQTKLVTLARN